MGSLAELLATGSGRRLNGSSCDGTIMEAAAAQCLLLAGFLQDQMRSRHDIRWYASLGCGARNINAFAWNNRGPANDSRS